MWSRLVTRKVTITSNFAILPGVVEMEQHDEQAAKIRKLQTNSLAIKPVVIESQLPVIFEEAFVSNED